MDAELSLYNMTGTKVLQQKLAGQSKTEISLVALPPGICLARIVSGNQAWMVKVIRQ